MKLVIYLSALIFFAGCKKDPQNSLIKEISGNYTISKLSYLRFDGTDSLVLSNIGQISFENCNSKDFNDNCPGNFQVKDEPVVSFRYNFRSDNENTISLIPFNSIEVKGLNLIVGYKILNKTDQQLKLSTTSATDKGKRVAITLDLQRK